MLIESVDNKAFLYTKKMVYETRQRLYELEELLKEKHFLRVSKSMLLIAPPADTSPIRFYGTLGVTVLDIYAAVMLMFWLQEVRRSRKLTQQLIDFQNGQTV